MSARESDPLHRLSCLCLNKSRTRIACRLVLPFTVSDSYSSPRFLLLFSCSSSPSLVCRRPRAPLEFHSVFLPSCLLALLATASAFLSATMKWILGKNEITALLSFSCSLLSSSSSVDAGTHARTDARLRLPLARSSSSSFDDHRQSSNDMLRRSLKRKSFCDFCSASPATSFDSGCHWPRTHDVLHTRHGRLDSMIASDDDDDGGGGRRCLWSSSLHPCLHSLNNDAMTADVQTCHNFDCNWEPTSTPRPSSKDQTCTLSATSEPILRSKR